MMPGSVYSSGIPLSSSGWLSTGYMLTQADLEKWLTQLCRALQPLHEKNRLYGTVSPDHVLLDPHGMVQIATERAIPAESRAASEGLYDALDQGFAAFEQYVDDPAWPQGPWTDIYGLSALARSLILKQPPPDAVQRMVSDTCKPLQDMGLSGYSPEFLGAIDRGMSLLPQQRFADVDAFAERLGLVLVVANREASDPVPVVALAQVPVNTTPAAVPAPAGVSGSEATKKKAPIWMIAFVVVALIVASGYLLRDQNDSTPAAVTPLAPEIAAAQQPEQEPVSTVEREPEPVLPDSTPVTERTPSIDMEAYTAARTMLFAAEQEATGSQSPEQEAAHMEHDTSAVGPVQEVPAKEVPAKEAPAPVEVASTDIRVGLFIKPWGEVFINGASQGVSPPLRSLSLKPGEYRVKVVNGDLPPHQQALTVQEGESASIAHDFEPGG